MLKERASVAKAWIKVTSFDLSPQVMATIDGLCREYSCTRFEALAVSTELYFRRDDNKLASVGILHGGRRGPQSLEVAGLLRTQVMDLVEIDGNPTAGESFGRSWQACGPSSAISASFPLRTCACAPYARRIPGR